MQNNNYSCKKQILTIYKIPAALNTHVATQDATKP